MSKLISPKLIYIQDRPREKLLRQGAESLTSRELLQAILGYGNKYHNVAELATHISKLLEAGKSLNYEILIQIPGLNNAKICTLLAAFELAQRLYLSRSVIINEPKDLLPYLMQFADKKQEHLLAFNLDGAGRLLSKRVISVGTLTATLVHPREVFADAIVERAASVVLAHNHPSGNCSPSQEDYAVTQVLKDGGDLLGMRVEDHIIFTADGSYYSFKDKTEIL